MWSSDDPQLCATQEKCNIFIIRNGQPMESHALTAHLFSFSDLEVQVSFRIDFSGFEVSCSVVCAACLCFDLSQNIEDEERLQTI